jgi:hypothetical protein
MGFSVSGFAELSYVRDEMAVEAEKRARRVLEDAAGGYGEGNLVVPANSPSPR